MTHNLATMHKNRKPLPPPPKLLPVRVGSDEHWTSQTVTNWLEDMVASTEQAEIQQGIYRGPFVVAGANLATPSPARPSNIQFEPSIGLRRPNYWDLSRACQQDPEGWDALQQIATVALQVETTLPMPCAGYQIIQERFQLRMNELTFADPTQQRELFDTHYNDTIDSLQNLLNPQLVPVATRNLPRRDLTKYMTQWLRDNWINPYPDDEGLAELARTCCTSPQVVSNWLINARTRKWRPAIVKAVELHRPSHMLMEDSINIFDGNPVRPLDYGISRKLSF